MIFSSFTFVYFFLIVFSLYWLVRKKEYQNIILFISSYFFYGWIHPWFCLLIAGSTVVDYLCGWHMKKLPQKKKLFLVLSLVANLGMLGFFKYFNFFTDNIVLLLQNMGVGINPSIARIFLPVGISFYTFQTLSYTIDIYRGKLEPRKNFIDFAVFVSFFPQLVAGPIERAVHFLPQIEKKRNLKRENFEVGIPLIIQGFLKKLVIADNIAVYADKVYMYENPSFILLIAGTLAFTLQILADFAAYTDIARGTASMLGFQLVRNFNAPYLAISPSDFWRRWHISFSSWIRDYLYISLGGSHVKSKLSFFLVLLVSLGLSGLWHGAQWNFVFWGIYHAILLFCYHLLNKGGRWKPQTIYGNVVAWLLMFIFTVFGWMIFRAHDIYWLFDTFSHMFSNVFFEQKVASFIILAFVIIYSLPMIIFYVMERFFMSQKWLHVIIYSLSLIAIIIFHREHGQDFIYFQF